MMGFTEVSDGFVAIGAVIRLVTKNSQIFLIIKRDMLECSLDVN